MQLSNYYSSNVLSLKKIIQWLSDQRKTPEIKQQVSSMMCDMSIIIKDIREANTMWQIQACENDIMFFRGNYTKNNKEADEMQEMLDTRKVELYGTNDFSRV